MTPTPSATGPEVGHAANASPAAALALSEAGRLRESEAGRLREQARLDGTRTALERNRLGQFATPPTLALDIASYLCSLLPDGTASAGAVPGEATEATHGEIAGSQSRVLPVHFADPTVGTGSFFAALLQTLPPGRLASASGIEIDPEVALSARKLWSEAGLRVVTGDFADPQVRGGLPRPSLVLANPPYVRHHHLTPERKAQLRAQVLRETGLEVSGLSGFYAHCLLLSSAWMRQGGLAAWLIPSEFADVNYGAVLRRHLSEQVTLLRLHRFDPRQAQFDDALVSSAVVVFRKEPPAPGAQAEFSFGGTLSRPQSRGQVPLEELRAARKWSLSLGSPAPVLPARSPLATRFDVVSGRTAHVVAGANGQRSELRLGDLFRIRRGIATGANDLFILPREQALRLELPERYLRPILPAPRNLRGNVVEGGADGYPELDAQHCLIDCDLPEEELRQLHPSLWSYLQSEAARGVRKRYLVSRRTPWYKQEQRPPAPFLCTYMGRGGGGKLPLRFIWNRSQAVATNLYLLLHPTLATARAIEEQPGLGQRLFESLQGVGAEALREAGRVYGGGMHKIEPKELGRIALDPACLEPFALGWQPQGERAEPQLALFS